MRCWVSWTLAAFAGGLLACTAKSGSPVAPVDAFDLRDGGIVRGPKQQRALALVFTAHEFAEGAETILDALSQHKAKASFFLTGSFLENPAFGALTRRIIREGHYVGPHSDRHLLYCAWDDLRRTLVEFATFKADLQANLDKLEDFGVSRERYFLPPYEHFNQQIAGWSQQLGLTVVNFTPGTRSTADYTGEGDSNFVSSQAIFDSILAREKQDASGLNGFILLLHLGAGPRRADKFQARFSALLDHLSAQGYSFLRVDQLLSASGGTAGPVFEDNRRAGAGGPLVLLDATEGKSLGEATEAIFIRASQIGYRPADSKVGIAFAAAALPATFSVLNADSEAVVFSGMCRPVEAVWGSFSNHVELNFTAFQVPGRYYLRLGNAVSWPFSIGANVFDDLPDELLEFMRQQRCGFNPWLDASCHTQDGRTAYGPRHYGTTLDATGGWHDAADTLKYLLTSGNATAQMLLAYQLAASSHSPLADRFDSQGRTGSNGIPDLLDEARWGLEWMLKLHPSPNELYHQVGDDRDHSGRRLPQNDAVDYGWGPGGARVVYAADGKPQGLGHYQSRSTGLANLAGRYAAAMALAWQIWRDEPRQRAFAKRCLIAGREVYELGRSHEGAQQGNSFGAPYRYEETTWADDMEWGATELYRATGRRRYLAEARHYAQLAAAESWMGKEHTGHYQYYPFINLGHFRLFEVLDNAREGDHDLRAALAAYYREGIESCIRAGHRNPYHIGVPFIWCSNNLTTALATQCVLYEWMTGDMTYREFAGEQRDWLIGRNPWGVSMFTGIGREFPQDPHLMTVQLTGRRVPGGLVDGPVYAEVFNSLKGVSIRQPDPLAIFQGQAVYHDDHRDYSSNEPTMDGTASAILLWKVISTLTPETPLGAHAKTH